MPKLSLTLFGSLQITLDDEPITARLWAKPQALLAYLAAEADAPHRREFLAGLLWGEQSDDAARTSLRQALRQLHQAFGDDLDHFLTVTPQTIQFNSTRHCQLDVAEFVALIRACEQYPHRQRETCRACVERLQRAVALYRGDLLAGFLLKDSAAFEEWAAIKREQLRRAAMSALATLAEHYARRREFELMEQAARRQLEIDPLYEDAHRQVMRALTWRGQRNAALAQFESLRKRLAEEIGAPPEKETLALEASIRDGTCAHPPALTNVPQPLTSFIGRQREIAEVERLLETTRLLTLTGAGGCGKTRLALQVATAIVHANHFKDGVWWVDLAALSDPALVPQAVAAPFDLSESPGISLTNVLTNYLSSRQPLLILDNCEHLIEACAQLAETLLGACPQLRILATSRQALGVGGEVTWRVPSLALPRADQLPLAKEFLRCDAIQLFVERALTVAPNWKLTEHTETVAAICARLDGIPLALELAAARLKMLSVKQIAARLDARFDLLTNGSRTALPRHQTLRATMDWSYDLLSDEECALLRRLSVFAGGWTLEAAEAICAEDNSSVLDSMTALIDKSLVVVDQTDSAMRYRMLETVREYARERLLEANEAARVRGRHLDYNLKLAQAAEPKLHGPEQFVWLDTLELEHNNLRAALKWSLGEGRVERGLRLVAALQWFWQMSGYENEGRECAESLLNQPEAAAKTLSRASALLVAAYKTGWYSRSAMDCQYLEELIAIAREHGIEGKRLLALGLGFLGSNARADDLADGESTLEQGLAIARTLEDEWVLGLLLFLRGLLFRGKKDSRITHTALEESLTRFKSLGDKHMVAVTSSYICSTYFREGEFERARRETEQGLTFFRQAKSRIMVLRSLMLLGEIARAESRSEQAKTYYEEALGLARELGDKWGIAVASSNLGSVVLHNGALDSAKSLFVESLTLGRELGYPLQAAIALLGFAGVAAAKKQARRAAQLFAVVDALFQAGDKRIITPADEAEYNRNLAIAREQLDEASFNEAWAEGQKMTLERAVEYALQTSEVSETSDV